jgi:hypothetical protein
MRRLRTAALALLCLAMAGCDLVAGLFDPVNGHWEFASDTTASYTLGSATLSPDRSFTVTLTSSVTGGSVTASASGSYAEDVGGRIISLSCAASDFPADMRFARGTSSAALYTLSADSRTLTLAFDDGTITFTRK